MSKAGPPPPGFAPPPSYTDVNMPPPLRKSAFYQFIYESLFLYIHLVTVVLSKIFKNKKELKFFHILRDITYS